MSPRLRMALKTGGLELPETGLISVLRPAADMDLSDLPRDRVEVVQPIKPDHDHFQNMGFACRSDSDARAAAVIVCLPRAKALAQGLIAQACARSDGLVIVDGEKTDGADSMLKACRARVDVQGPVSKAHGKVFWFKPAPDAFADWQQAEFLNVGGFVTSAGVFSADGIDPASQMLADELPPLSGNVVDLGAGWGFLSAMLAKMPSVSKIDLVEADQVALNCAHRNVTDKRAHFHWADATNWSTENRVDAIVMNPPFHNGRASEPALGKTFISAAARLLAPSGKLWMVANRHLPYETTLSEAFVSVSEVSGDSRFKIFRAERPVRNGSRQGARSAIRRRR